MKKKKRWSKLQKKIEDIFERNLGLKIHANVYTVNYKQDSHRMPRIWLQCEKIILFDFPGDFFIWKTHSDRGAICYHEQETSVIGEIIDIYLSTPKNLVLESEWAQDRFGFADFLKVADRRLGLQKLKAKYGHLPPSTPLGALLQKREKSTAIGILAPIEFAEIDLRKEDTGLSLTLRARTKATRAGYTDPREPPTLRVVSDYSVTKGILDPLFAIELKENPEPLEIYKRNYNLTMIPLDQLQQLLEWIRDRRLLLLEYWHSGLDWTPAQTTLWLHKL